MSRRRRRSRRFRRVRLLAACLLALIVAGGGGAPPPKHPTHPHRLRAACLLALIVAGAAARSIQKNRLDADAAAARATGEAALAAGEYEKAVDGLGRYLQRHADEDATAEDYV